MSQSIQQEVKMKQVTNDLIFATLGMLSGTLFQSWFAFFAVGSLYFLLSILEELK